MCYRSLIKYIYQVLELSYILLPSYLVYQHGKGFLLFIDEKCGPCKVSLVLVVKDIKLSFVVIFIVDKYS